MNYNNFFPFGLLIEKDLNYNLMDYHKNRKDKVLSGTAGTTSFQCFGKDTLFLCGRSSFTKSTFTKI